MLDSFKCKIWQTVAPLMASCVSAVHDSSLFSGHASSCSSVCLCESGVADHSDQSEAQTASRTTASGKEHQRESKVKQVQRSSKYKGQESTKVIRITSLVQPPNIPFPSLTDKQLFFSETKETLNKNKYSVHVTVQRYM